MLMKAVLVQVQQTEDAPPGTVRGGRFGEHLVVVPIRSERQLLKLLLLLLKVGPDVHVPLPIG
jgi:hypothetical protein